ncbi:MAG: hypothetical protein JXB23_12600 [Candidatus Aminicenantes bacterium]|nr:hypothetical protein [Candidatus Aminicenantes bacterium]
MRNSITVTLASLALVLIALLSGCLTVRVIKNVKDPDRHFVQAYKRIEDIHKRNPEREGRTHRIHALFFEASEQELIRISAPFWIIDSCLDFRITTSDEEFFDFNHRYDIDWKDIRDLQQMGPGLLVEIDDEDGKVLIWVD